MARITVNTTGTQPTLVVSTDISNVANAALAVTCLQDITITNSTGIYSWTDFCSIDTNKITTPADNEISTNMVIDSTGYFGTTPGATSGNAAVLGVAGLSINKVPVSFKIVLNGNTATANAFFYTGVGYISSLAPTVSPDAPVWITPMTLAVDGDMTVGKNP